MAQDPNSIVHDSFRKKDFGVVAAVSNSKPATSNFYVDRSRLGVHEEYDPEVKNDWGGHGKYVEKPNRIVDNARDAAMRGTVRSSFKDINAPAAPTGSGPCCPSPYGYDRSRSNKERGGE